MIKPTEKTIMHSYPGMVAIITVTYKGSHNVMAAGWHSYISYEPPIYGVAIGRERYTYDLIKKAGCFAVNFLPYDMAEFIQQAGVFSGESLNKFSHSKIEFDTGEKIKAPILKDAYIAYECKTIDINTYGDHDWFVGDIVQFHRDDDLFHANNLPNFTKLEIPLYLGRSSYLKVDNNVAINTYRVEEISGKKDMSI